MHYEETENLCNMSRLHILCLFHSKIPKKCADPECFVRGVLTLEMLFLWVFLIVVSGREGPNTTEIGPSLDRQQKAI